MEITIPKIEWSIEGLFGFVKNLRNYCYNIKILIISGIECEEVISVEDSCADKLSNKMEFDSIYINDSTVSDSLLKHLANLISCNSIVLYECDGFTKNGLLYLKHMNNLNDLSINGCQEVEDEHLESLQEFKKLSSFSLDSIHSGVTDIGAGHVFSLIALRSLTFNYQGITSKKLCELSNLTNLKFLCLEDCENIDDDVMSSILKLTNLTNLNLSGCTKITSQKLSALSKINNLTSLSLRECTNVTDKVMQNIGCLKKLTALDISDCPEITDTVVESLIKLSNLSTLALSGKFKYVSQIIKHCVLLESLKIHDGDTVNQMNVDDIKSMRGKLRSNTEVQDISQPLLKRQRSC